jgi:hypothetical protein
MTIKLQGHRVTAELSALKRMLPRTHEEASVYWVLERQMAERKAQAPPPQPILVRKLQRIEDPP